MLFYSGFCLQNESAFFKPFLSYSDFHVAGFSYGAIKAFEETKRLVEGGRRIDRLTLLSPAFFQNKPRSFAKLQLRSFEKESKSYMQKFFTACFAPHPMQKIETKEDTKEDLEKLLGYIWNDDELRALEAKGVVIEVYLGEKDAIIDAEAALEFFSRCSNVTYIKNANHFLLTP